MDLLETYLETVPEDRRADLRSVWEAVRASVPAGYEEACESGMLLYRTGSEWYVALANRKNYLSLYLMPIYVFPEMKARLEASGKKLKGGKSCIHFRRVDDLPLDVIREIVGATPAEAYRARVVAIRAAGREGWHANE